MRRLQEWTGRRWIVAVVSETGAASLKEAADEKAREGMNGVRAEPLVRRALEMFPGAEIVAVRVTEAVALGDPPRPAGAGDDDIGFIDDSYADADP
jgi:DNA polymerase-3 subunit gamma/tau